MALDKELTAAAAMADTSKLTPFEGCDVVRSTIAITKAGDGLSAAMAVAPIAYHHGDRVYVLLECEVIDVQHPPVSRDVPNVLMRKHKFEAQAATVVEGKWAREAIDKQKKDIDLARDKARGQDRLVGADGDDSTVNPAAKPTKAAQKAADAALRELSKTQLRELCLKHGLTHAAKATGETLVGLLLDVPGIGDEALALLS